MGLRGIPDFLLCINSTFVAIELKVSADLEELQKWNISEIQKSGGVAMVVTPENFDTAYAFLHAIAVEGLDKAKQKFH